ncbi:DUF4398 domain-containing protein [Luteimonas sp. MJ204]|uniref:DUF4398 domain-containing protein n=1 Tax=Luteimonas TaxID=83614 RepID=UPI0031BA60EC
MRTSFAHFQIRLHGACLVLAVALAGCATLPPPTAELSAAREAVARADAADAQQYAPQDLDRARTALSRAQAAMTAGKERDARALAGLSEASADLASARSAQAQVDSTLAQRRAEVASLRRSLGMEDQR